MICMTLGPVQVCSDPGAQSTESVSLSDPENCMSHLSFQVQTKLNKISK